MQFIFPAFLIAGLAIAIPILIHLFYFRKFKQVYFTNVRFLKEIKEETASRSRLKNLLVLLMRILAILAMVAAFAQPFLPRGEAAGSGPKAVAIYIDNSFSMQAQSKDVALMEVAKSKARQLVEGYNTTDKFQIITNTFSGKSQRLVSQDEALAMIDEITVSPVVQTLPTILVRQQQILKSEADRKPIHYLISDFQESITGLPETRDSTAEIYVIPLKAIQEQNVSIDSLWFEGPVLINKQPNTMIVRVKNHGAASVEQVRLSLLDGPQEKPVGTMNIPANSQVFDTIIYTPQQSGWQALELRINDYPIQFDDHFYAASNVLDRLRVLVIHDLQPNRFLQKSLENRNAMEGVFQLSGRIDYDQMGTFQLIVLDGLPELSSGLQEALKAFLKAGGNVLIFPPAKKNNLPGYNEFFKITGARQLGSWLENARDVGQINTNSFVFRDVYMNSGANLTLPSTKANYSWSGSGAVPEEQLLIYRDGQTMIGRYVQGTGNLFLSAAPLDEAYSSLGKSGEVFIPMLYKMALSGNRRNAVSYTIGVDEEVALQVPVTGSAERLLRLRSDEIEFVPQQRFVGSEVRLGIQNGLEQAGNYALITDKEEVQGMLGMNFNRLESVQEFLTPEDLETLGFNVVDDVAAADLSVWVGEKERGIVLWRLCVILALVFLGIETLLLRFWKT
ncbi:MAG: BatA domain-containing protein [Saprospiraceae bacterium]|jgi:hypothetical protein|nr:BatA domain-containing protein [Saprospiraceae bacterium]